MTDPIKAAALRFAAALLALAVGAGMVTFIPDPNLKMLGGGLAASAIFALEEFLKTKAGI